MVKITILKIVKSFENIKRIFPGLEYEAQNISTFLRK